MTDGASPVLFPPPAATALLYRGPVMHARMKPAPHRFTYGVFSLLIDVGRLDAARRLSRFFSIGRFNLLAFDPKDHGPEDGGPLFDHVAGLLGEAGLTERPARVLLWCYPRVFGLVFNPIAIYFAYAHDDRLIGLVYEVRNTFGDKHSYVAPVREGELSTAGLRQARDKLFYVSPFMDMPMRYRFRIRPPGATLAVRILETDSEGPILAATFHGDAAPLSDRMVLGAVLPMPWQTLKVVGGIHWEALKLWFKGVRFHQRPPAPPAASLDGRFLPEASAAPGNRSQGGRLENHPEFNTIRSVKEREA
jgi:hypothetical protein